MKKLSWLLVAALPLVLFFSCQKQIASTAAASRTPSMMAGGCGVHDNTPSAGFATVTLTPAVPVAGQPLQVCISVPCGGLNSLTINKGGVAVATVNKPDGPPPSSLCVTFTPTAADCADPAQAYTLAVQYNNSQSNGCGGPYCVSEVQAQVAAVCIPVVAACTTPLTITGHVDNVSTADGWSTITVTYCVTACQAITGVKTQGGATAGGNVGATTPTNVTAGATINALNNNYVINWTDDFAAGQTRCYSFTYSRAFTACGSVTGAWSAKSANGLATATVDPLTACP